MGTRIISLVAFVFLLAGKTAGGGLGLYAVLQENGLTEFAEVTRGLQSLILSLYDHSNGMGGANVTVLAPSDDALKALKATKPDWNTDIDLWKYHILLGYYETDNITALPRIVQTLSGDPHDVVDLVVHVEETRALSAIGNAAAIVAPDIPFDGGIVQIIDSVLVPPRPLASAPSTASISSFLSYLHKAGIMDDIEAAPNVTIFAPSDAVLKEAAAAAAAAGGGGGGHLSWDTMPATALAAQLWSYIVYGQVMYSPGIASGEFGQLLRTHAGPGVRARLDGPNLFVGNALVVQPDLLVQEGVVHVINSLFPALALSTSSLPTRKMPLSVSSSLISPSVSPGKMPTISGPVGPNEAGTSRPTSSGKAYSGPCNTTYAPPPTSIPPPLVTSAGASTSAENWTISAAWLGVAHGLVFVARRL